MELILIIILLSIGLDMIIGELPSQIHPVVWMGHLIDFLKKPLLKINNKISGLILTFLVVSFFIFVLYLILIITYQNIFIFILISSLVLSSTFAINLLIKTALEVNMSIKKDINHTRKLVSYLVSRDTSNLSTEELSSATIESLTENINDSVIAPFFFLIIAYIISYFIMITYHTSFLIIIAPILVAMTYRCVNTLDAMVGYKTPKYFLIGWFPARTDDYLNYLPSRITGFLVVISSALINLDWRNSWRIMLRDAKKTLSPNSGYPMAAAAGALHIQLQKVGIYTLGDPDYSIKSDIIGDAIKLSAIAIFLFLVAVIFLIILINYLV